MREVFYFLVFFSPCLLSASIFVSGELLYWKARENGLSLAIKSKGSPTFVEDGRVKDIDFQYDLGARITIDFSLPKYPKWELFLQGTHFHNYTHTDVKAKEDFLFPIWINAAATGNGFIDAAKARWRLHFGMADLDLCRTVSLGKHFSLKPYVGLRSLVARQKYEISYLGGALFPQGEDEVHMKNKFWGIGPLAGIRADLTLYKTLALYANVDLALPYGHFYIHQSEYATTGSKRRLRLFHTFSEVKAMSDFAIGIEGGYKKISFNLAWEYHLLFGQNQLIRLVSSDVPAASVSNQGDLTLSGLVGGVTVKF
jgi:major outer membrane protein